LPPVCEITKLVTPLPPAAQIKAHQRYPLLEQNHKIDDIKYQAFLDYVSRESKVRRDKTKRTLDPPSTHLKSYRSQDQLKAKSHLISLVQLNRQDADNFNQSSTANYEQPYKSHLK